MDAMEALSGVEPESLTAEQKQKSLRAVNLIKLKKSGNLKVRVCDNGAPYRKFVPREEAKSLTINLEGFLASMVIDVYEDRKVATFDIPGAYLQIDLPKEKFTLLLLEGKFVDIMGDINITYKQNLRLKYSRKTLYIRIIKAIYGMIESYLLCYKLYMSVIKDIGFQINPYAICVANKYINNKQCTIAWYVDDNKVSHMVQEIIDDVISKAEERLQ